MRIALAEKITLGGTSFYDVPVMVHDYGGLPLGNGTYLMALLDENFCQAEYGV